jgi:hypothetical protein
MLSWVAGTVHSSSIPDEDEDDEDEDEDEEDEELSSELAVSSPELDELLLELDVSSPELDELLLELDESSIVVLSDPLDDSVSDVVSVLEVDALLLDIDVDALLDDVGPVLVVDGSPVDPPSLATPSSPHAASKTDTTIDSRKFMQIGPPGPCTSVQCRHPIANPADLPDLALRARPGGATKTTFTRQVPKTGTASDTHRRGDDARGTTLSRAPTRSLLAALGPCRHRREPIRLFVALEPRVPAHLQELELGELRHALTDLVDELEIRLRFPSADQHAEAPSAVRV